MENGSSAGLERKLGLFPLTNVVIANMIGAGIFTTSGLLMGDLGNPLLLLSLWVVGGVIALCGALSYGMLGAAIPHSGGEYAFLSRIYHPLGPWVYHSMAKDRLFFRGLARVDPGTNVPARSIALQGVLSSMMVLSGTFDQILTVMGFALGIFPLFAVAGVLRTNPPGGSRAGGNDPGPPALRPRCARRPPAG